MPMRINPSDSGYVTTAATGYQKKKTSKKTKKYGVNKGKGYILEISEEGMYRSEIENEWRGSNVYAKTPEVTLQNMSLPKYLTAKMKKAIAAYKYQMAFSKKKKRVSF